MYLVKFEAFARMACGENVVLRRLAAGLGDVVGVHNVLGAITLDELDGLE